jgi:hypothetical protein
MEFRVKRIDTNLFGVVEADNQEPFWKLFEAGGTTAIQLDAATFASIGVDLGLHLDHVAEDLHDYVKGHYRPTEESPGGNRLGDFAEAIAYLVLRDAQEDVVRVVGADRGPRQQIKGTDFPQPDYIVRRKGKSGCVEVKGTDALDFLELDAVENWKLLKPCGQVAVCRSRALPQLGYPQPTQPRVAYAHRLRLRDDKTITFPVDFGAGVGLLARDGRIDALENDARFRTPPACRNAKRECWKCMKASNEWIHLTSVWMHNEPGKLDVLGSGREGDGWLRAYVRWGQAVWSREADAAGDATSKLVKLTEAWIEERGRTIPVKRSLRQGWESYARACLADRGLWPVAAETSFAGVLGEERFTQEDALRRPDEPHVEVQGREAPIRWDIAQGPRRLSVARAGHDDSYSMFISGTRWHIRLASNQWWRGAKVTKEEAQKIATRLIALGRRLFDTPALPEVAVPLVPVRARVGDTEISLGWRSHVDGPWLLEPWIGFPWARGCCPELYVFPDGRGYLRASTVA